MARKTLALLLVSACAPGGTAPTVRDDDNDGVTSVIDCRDDDPSIHPFMDEVCNGVDEDCDGEIDEGVGVTFWADGDGDGHGDPGKPISACERPEGAAETADDCDDADPYAPPACPSSLLGTWPTFGGNEGRTGYFPGLVASARLERRWTMSFDGYQPHGWPVVGDVLVVGYVHGYGPSSPGRVLGLDPFDGSEIWRHVAPAVRDDILPATLHDGVVYVPEANHADSRLWALSAADGKPLWWKPYAAQWHGYESPLVADGGLWIGAGYYGGIYGFDADDGALRFIVGLPFEDGWTPSWHEGRVYTYAGGKLTAHDPDDGATLDAVAFESAIAIPTEGRSVALEDGSAYLTTPDAVYAIDVDTMTVRWADVGDFHGTPAVASGRVYALRDGRAQVYDAASGEHVGEYAGDGRLRNQAIVTDDALIVSSSDRTWIYDLATSALRDELPVGGHVALAHGHLYVLDGGFLEAWAFVED